MCRKDNILVQFVHFLEGEKFYGKIYFSSKCHKYFFKIHCLPPHINTDKLDKNNCGSRKGYWLY